MRILILGLFAALTAGPAIAARATDAEKLQKELDGLTAGAQVDCIRLQRNLNSTTYDGAIVYRDGGTRYLNRFDGGCTMLDNNDAIVTRSYNNQVCRGDIVTIVAPLIPIAQGSCVFGRFTPYTKPR